jgi:hypothetical protein
MVDAIRAGADARTVPVQMLANSYWQQISGNAVSAPLRESNCQLGAFR